MKQLNSSDWAKAGKLATDLAGAWSVMQPSEAKRMAFGPMRVKSA